ncbi:sporulation protein YpjB [Jeotgalibacillus salarius]|uniref:Uncharacterized protein n=1 Tax=Jeotgalibacillus salarius TaxID=546023 RepID=A0A4Y8LKH9_9BACL|nr:sporulation protein YpjB [Jeotgalibacillus salarius]TFE03072.1 hypothetical protein E2626_04470 [Jeotgalibacillus salarius]
MQLVMLFVKVDVSFILLTFFTACSIISVLSYVSWRKYDKEKKKASDRERNN